MKRLVFLSITASLVSVMAMAQSSLNLGSSSSSSPNDGGSSSTSLGNMIRQKEYKQDEHITDMQINARSGSLSRYSATVTMSYDGASVTDMGSDERPNPLNRPGDMRTKMGGQLGARYRFSSDDSITFGGGLSYYFSHKNSDENPTDMNNPNIGYDHTYMIGPFQSHTGFGVSDVTQSVYVAEGEFASIRASHMMKYYVPNTRWIAGLMMGPSGYFYTRGYRELGQPGVVAPRRGRGGSSSAVGISADPGQLSDYGFMVLPTAEYILKDHLHITASWAQQLNHYRRFTDATTFSADTGSARVGLAWGVTRDIYVSPYIGAYPTAMSLPNTWFALDTIVSIF